MATSKLTASNTLLWSNPSPTTGLDPVTLNIDTSKYKFLRLVLNWFASGSLNEIVTFDVENGRRNLVSVAKDVPGFRYIDLQTSGQIVISEGQQYYNGAVQIQNARLTPIEIWGVVGG